MASRQFTGLVSSSTARAAVFLLPLLLDGARLTFREYGPEQGLNNIGSHTMLQDRDGFFWVGTYTGLFRYNGKRFERFGERNGLPSSAILSLRETADGVLWVATSAGLARRDGEQFRREGPLGAAFLPGANLVTDSRDRLYIGTTQGLLIGVPNGRGPERSFQFQTGTAAVTAVHVDQEGGVWFGCARKLCRLESGKIETIGPENGVPPESWESILTDREGALWIRSSRRLLVRKHRSDRFVPDKSLPASDSDASLYLDRDGNLLVTSDVGLARRRSGHWELIDARRGLATNSVTSIYQDRDGSLWLGLRGVGIARWLGYNLSESWTVADGLASPVVWSILDDARNIWIGTDQGLNYLPHRGGEWRVWTRRHGLPGDHIFAVAPDADGGVWVATLPGGLAHVNPLSGEASRYGRAAGLPQSTIFGILLDSEKRLWVGSAVGLFRSTSTGNRLRFERQFPSSGDSREIFRRLLEDRNGRIWVAGSRGVAYLEKGRWTRLHKQNGLEDEHTAHLAETADGAIWVGYHEAFGLTRLMLSDGKWKVQHVSQRDDGLASDNIVFLGSDRNGCLWAGTDGGVAAYDGRSWHRYGREDGLVSDYPNLNAFLAAADGDVWIGTAKGLTRLRPSDAPAPVLPPRVAITSVTLGSKTYGPSDSLTARYFEKSLRVDFSSLRFADEGDFRFRYRLAGLEPQWTTARTGHALYPGLPPGSYTFEVLAGTTSGVWSVEPARISFRILPAWWETWWLRLAGASTLLGAIAWIWRRRVTRLMKHQEELSTIIREKTRRESILQAVSFAAQGFLYGGDWKGQIRQVLERFGSAADADSVRLYEHHPGPAGEPRASLRSEWSVRGPMPDAEFRRMQDLRFQDGFARWKEMLIEGDMIHGRVDCFPPTERAILDPQGIKLVAVVPVLTGSTLWGHIGFYQFHETEWSAVELEAVKAAARILGAAIRRSQIELALRASQDDLEHRVRERTRTLLQEIHERRSVEETLKQTEMRFQAVFDEAPIGMNLLDLDGRIVESNVALQQMLGYTRDQMNGRAFTELSHPDDFEMDFLCFGELIQHKRERYVMEKRYHASDGSVVWARLTVSLLKSSGGESFAIAMVEDITDHKQLEEQFRQSQKMEAIGQLAGGIAHDFNNLLTVIKGYSELLVKRMEDENPIKKKLGQIRKAADRAAALVSQLLAFSRKQVIAPRVLDLNSLIRDVEKMLRRLIGEDIQFVTILNRVSPVKADPGQLEQVLMNLTVNARDAMPGGGRILIETSPVELANASRDGLPPGNYTVLAVADTGAGMTDDVRSRIFEPFFTTKEVGQGTGLGLSTVYGIVKQSGGAIFVESAPGQGSRFEIYWPSVEAMPQALDDLVHVAARTHGNETILVVEDEPLVRAMIIEALTDRGYRVLAAPQGTDACRIAAECEAIHLLVTDVVLPGMSGVEVARGVLEHQPAARVLYVCGYNDLEFEAGVFLAKPFGPEDLVQKVREVLDMNRGDSPVAQDRITSDELAV